MKVLYITTECKPFSKMGGVGDVAGELPPALNRQDVEIEIVTPLYGIVSPDLYDNQPQVEFVLAFNGRDERVRIHQAEIRNVPVVLVGNETYFEGRYSRPYVHSENIPFYDDVLRFSFFSEVCLQLIREKQPDIVHINDWPLGYLFGRMAIEGLPSRKVLTIHNIGYQGNIGKEVIRSWDIERILADRQVGHLFIDPRAEWNSVNALRLALELSDNTNTVSPNYCKEIMLPEDPDRYFAGGKGLHEVAHRAYEHGRLVGILNGFDYTFDPTESRFSQMLDEKAKMKRLLARDFSNPDAFLLGFVGRAVEQKFKLLAEVIDGKSVLEQILSIPGVNVAVLATGLPQYETFLRNFTDRNNCSVTIAFDRTKAKQISIGSDVFLMPSLFEPCGITQMESLNNATPPLVRWTGGLVDTVKPYTDASGTGFGFDGSTREAVLRNLIGAVVEAAEFYTHNKDGFRQLQKRGFSQRFLWSATAKKYVEKLYQPVSRQG
jgi:starch synthase